MANISSNSYGTLLTYPEEVDPFAPLFKIPLEEMLQKADESRHDGFAPFKINILPPTQTEINEVQSLANSLLPFEEPLLPIDDPEMSPLEAPFFHHLHRLIYNDRWIQFIGDQTFIETSKIAISTLLQKDIGRSLLLTAYRIHDKFILEQGKSAHMGTRDNEISTSLLHIFVHIKPIYYPAILPNGKKLLSTLPLHITIGHELLHTMQQVSILARSFPRENGPATIQRFFFQAPTTDREFPNLVERVTILGVEGIIPSENALHYAFGTLKCFSYFPTGFPAAITDLSPSKKHYKLIDGCSRIEIAAKRALDREVEILLETKLGTPVEALFGALQNPSENKKLIQSLVKHPGLDITKQIPLKNISILEHADTLYRDSRISEEIFLTILSNLAPVLPAPISSAPLLPPSSTETSNRPIIVVHRARREAQRTEADEFFENIQKIFLKIFFPMRETNPI